uniref:Uncharacterized protein n=1 Tax=Bionectria ochroleuca TaxID=29856 RepID=A0A8H7NGE8_BIOOC
MMASRNGPKGPAPKKNAVTYGKAPRSRPLGSLNTITESNPYDFPDSDGSDASTTPRKLNPPKMKPTTLPRPSNVHRGPIDTGRARVPAKQKKMMAMRAREPTRKPLSKMVSLWHVRQRIPSAHASKQRNRYLNPTPESSRSRNPSTRFRTRSPDLLRHRTQLRLLACL